MKRKNNLFAPGWCSDQRPDAVVKGEDGPIALWFRAREADAPEKYDVAVPQRGRRRWVVYMLFLTVALLCLLPAIMGAMG